MSTGPTSLAMDPSPAAASQLLRGRGDLERYFRQGCKQAQELQVGVEWEKIGVQRETGFAIPYSGPRGVVAIFDALCKRFDWSLVEWGGHAVALTKGPTSITLEPGGQIELSGWKSTELDGNALELYSHLDEIRQVSEPLGIVWLGLGAQPFSTAEDIEWVPKERYALMRESLRNKGELTYSMMKETASVQISVDYTDERDAAEKLRLAMALTPFLVALFANSPLYRGRPSGFLSRRAHIWSKTAPERTGVIEQALRPDFGFAGYVDYALDVPMLFIVRNGRWVSMSGTFRQFLEKGFQGERPTLEDWELHLTGIFTEARLKKYIEIRSIDCQNAEMGLAAVALIKGLFYDAVAQKKAWDLTGDVTPEERVRLAEEAPRLGLKTAFAGRTLRASCSRLVDYAEQGLRRMALQNLALAEETRYLRPLKEIFTDKKGMNPAETLLARLGKSGAHDTRLRRVLKHAAI